MPYSIIINNKVYDITYQNTKHPDLPMYQVRLGHQKIGTVSKLPSGWFAITNNQVHAPNQIRSVGGFKTRYAATEYILLISGYRERTNF